MNEARPNSRLAPAMIVAGFLLAVLGGYVAGYFLVSTGKYIMGTRGTKMRLFEQKWPCAFYAPMARFEAAVLGIEVRLCYPDPDNATQKGAYRYD